MTRSLWWRTISRATRGRYADAKGICRCCGVRRSRAADGRCGFSSRCAVPKSNGYDRDALGVVGQTDRGRPAQSVIDEFNKTHPNIRVDYSVINGDYSTAMTAPLRGPQPAGRLLRRLEPRVTWAAQGVLPARTPTSSREVRHRGVLPEPANAFKVGGKTSTASRRTGRRSRWRSTRPMLVKAQHEGPDDVGAAHGDRPGDRQVRTPCPAESRSA